MNKRTVYEGHFRVEIIETQFGEQEVIRSTGSACVLLYNRSKRYIVLIRQPRVSLMTSENSEGLITETVAGSFDCGLGVKSLLVKESQQEAGITITEDAIELLNHGKPLSVSAGMTDDVCYLAFAEIDDDQVDPEDGVFGSVTEGERIQRLMISIDELPDYVCEDLRAYCLIRHLLRKIAVDG
ncbi:MAG: hypothetical protein COV70_02445 [Parcubacteria group bacterium CG11_big_fil_rev_8_21_14_0_20_39_22]|nr:MAG: hypothetical protein COV70_02445 [Parcubacteria group bacterium CG11_big_fil_rev_8_21_14_0_20_39_22]